MTVAGILTHIDSDWRIGSFEGDRFEHDTTHERGNMVTPIAYVCFKSIYNQGVVWGAGPRKTDSGLKSDLVHPAGYPRVKSLRGLRRIRI